MAVVLSQHSSNPLDVGSSDARNAQYLGELRTAQAARARRSYYRDDSLSSDDPINALAVEGLRQYQEHLAIVISNRSAPRKPHNAYVDLDEDMESDDLVILPPRTKGTISRVTSDDHSADDDIECHDDVMHDNLPEDDEEMTIYRKSAEEREEIELEIADLEEMVPELADHYKLVDRLGTGTFSSVYKAIDQHYDIWDNNPWEGTPSSASHSSDPYSDGARRFVAVKRIYVTSSPERIRNEIAIMEECRGCRHISQLITAFREADQVVAIMPYHRNDDFREYFRILPMIGIKAYMRCLFRALRDIHLRGIIHRDVKPANFLFDPRTGEGILCDFGLASRMDITGPTSGACFHTPPTRDHPHGQISKNAFPTNDIRAAQLAAKTKSKLPPEKVGYLEKDTRPVAKANRAGTRGFRAPEVLFKCVEQSGAIDVWAAGMILLFFLTGKFPLFQSNDDIEALMEIAAIVGYKEMENVATLHSRTFCTNVPSVEKTGVSWCEFVERQNLTLFESHEPDMRYYPHNQVAYHEHIRSVQQQKEHSIPPSSSTVSSPPSLYYPRSSSQSPPRQAGDDMGTLLQAKRQRDIQHALDLVERIMDPYSTRRWTPQQALAHPFLRGEDGDFDEVADDDEFAPHCFGEGVCAEWHFIDETGKPCVKVPCVGVGGEEGCEEVIILEAGQGLAIGRQPCEYHQEMGLYMI